MTAGDAEQRALRAIAAGEERVRRIERSEPYLLGQALLQLRPTPTSLWRFLRQVRDLRSVERQLKRRIPLRNLGESFHRSKSMVLRSCERNWPNIVPLAMLRQSSESRPSPAGRSRLPNPCRH